MSKQNKSNVPAKNQSSAMAKPAGDVLVKTLRRDLYDQRRTFAGLLGVPEDSQTFTAWLAEVAHVVGLNAKLLEADRGSLMQSLRHAITLGLSINPALGEAYLIPRWDKNARGNVVQCQLGYRGLMSLMYRSDMIDSVGADVIYRGETYTVFGGTNARIEHVPDVEGTLRTNKFDDIVVAYASVHLRGSTRPVFVYLTKPDLERARSMNLDRDKNPSLPWREHPQSMAIKTALARVSKMLPRHSKLAELHKALAAEFDEPGITVGLADQGDHEQGSESPWDVACDAFSRFDVHPEHLLAHLNIDSVDAFTSDHDAVLRELHAKIRGGDEGVLARLLGTGTAVDVPNEPTAG